MPQNAWDAQLGNSWPVAVINLLSAQVEDCPEPIQVVKPLELFNRGRATSGRVTDQELVRDLQRAAPMVHPESPSHVVGSTAERLTRPVSWNLSEWSRTT